MKELIKKYKEPFLKYILPVIMVILVIVVWKSANFLKSSSGMLSNIFAYKLPFKVNPIRTGGDIIAVIEDKIEDNKHYDLPRNNDYKEGYQYTDIITYIVHKPIGNFDGGTVWNLDIELLETKINDENPNKFDLIKGSVYIDLNDDNNTGDCNPYSTGENIKFSEGFKWDYYVEFDPAHNDAKMISAATEKVYPVHIIFLKSKNLIRLSLPAVESINNKMDKKYMGRHIVAVGFYSPLERGKIIPLSENADRTHSGAGSNYSYLTPYYDFVVLSIDKKENEYLTLQPVNLNNYGIKSSTDNINEIKEKLKIISEKEYDSNYGNIDNIDIKNAKEYYNNKEYNKAEEILTKYTEMSSIANTYLGLISARKAGNDKLDVSKKVDLVNLAYEYFDKSESLVSNDNDLYILLTNRTGVSISVPDEVFSKLNQAENDIKKILKLADLKTEEKAKYINMLIDIYKEKNKISSLRILLNDLNKMNII